MMFVLLMAGIGLLLAGLLTVGLGIQMDLSFGNTLILTGAIAACTGMIMLSLWAVARELKKIALGLGAGIPLESRARTETAPGRRNQAPDNDRFPPSRDQRGPEDLDNLELEVEAPTSAPWQAEAAGRDRGRNDGAIAPEPAEAAPAAKKARRNLMFSSSSRKERERAPGRMPDPSVADLGPVLPPRESNEVPPASIEDAWPKLERSRGADLPPQRRSGRAPPAFTETNGAAGGDRYAPPTRREDRSGVTILKSGVVDGMAYSLYSDGSIEAQMPEGMMRFASIEDLRAHLDQRP
jgi:hypothetical protein